MEGKKHVFIYRKCLPLVSGIQGCLHGDQVGVVSLIYWRQSFTHQIFCLNLKERGQIPWSTQAAKPSQIWEKPGFEKEWREQGQDKYPGKTEAVST